MGQKYRLFTPLVISCLSFAAALMHGVLEGAHKYPENIIFIGDSISDNGNAQPSSQVPALPYPSVISATPITNGVTFAGLLSNMLKVCTTKPSTQGGLDFAYAGALTLVDVASLGNPGLPLISLYNQVDLISSKVSRKIPVFSFGGANDFLRPLLDGSFIFPTGASVADNMVQVVKKIHKKGFKTQFISNMPDLGALPFAVATGTSAIFTPLSQEFNAELKRKLQQKSYHVVQIDTASLFALITANPDRYGFTFGANLPDPSANLAGYMFYYDGVHPSEALDRIFAEYVFSQFEAANFFGSLAEMPFAVLRQQNTTLLQQLYPLSPRQECGCLKGFIGGNYAPLLKEDTFGLSKYDGHGGDIAVGVSHCINRCLSWGVSGSYALNRNRGHNDFKTDLSVASGSVFGSLCACNSYLNAIFTGSWLDYSKVHRSYHIGPIKERLHGSTHGQAYYGLLNGGYSLLNCSTFSTGPIASLEYGVVKINGYKEHGASAGNLKYRNQTGHEFITGLGWEANFNYQVCSNDRFQQIGCLPAFSEVGLNVSLSVNRQWLGNHRNVLFKEVSINGAYGALPYEMTRMTYYTGGVNLYTQFCNDAVFSLGYFLNVGASDLSENRITVGLSMPFSFF